MTTTQTVLLVAAIYWITGMIIVTKEGWGLRSQIRDWFSLLVVSAVFVFFSVFWLPLILVGSVAPKRYTT